MSVVIETTIGDITIDLFTSTRPKTCLNFVKLCKTKYYHFCVFHFVQKDFIAQTGDPSAIAANDGSSGRGGHSVFSQLYGEQGRYFEAENKPKISHNKIGLVSMVDNGERMHGSQFFITLSDNLDYLDSNHTVFGVVAEGIDVVVKLNETITDAQFRPYQDIVITHTVILDDPFPDPKGLDIPPQSPEVSEEFLRSNRIGVHETIDDTEGKSAQEIDEDIKTKEARERALVLEMIGDIPDAEIKPPENVLFVCKLNPVTREDDLEVIFSRFGPIVSCEVIRDPKSGESLQYAFIEFENEADCEKAYFKMDNVLIDDRRIHVDFSQSVSKIKWDRKEKKTDRSSHQTEKASKDRQSGSHREKERHRERERSDSRDRRNQSRERRNRDHRKRSRERTKRSHEKHRSRSRDRSHKKHSRTHSSRNRSSSSDDRSHRKSYNVRNKK